LRSLTITIIGLERIEAMTVIHDQLEFETEGNFHIVEISDDISEMLRETGLGNGILTVFVPGATGAVTTLEHEPGVCKDFRELFDSLAPVEHDYHHNRRGVDSNGHSHVRAGLLGPSITVPFIDGKPQLGRWQQLVFIDFDEVPRSRTLLVTFVGE
jgi:secondary thiamine-phosphate synthase enzyme